MERRVDTGRWLLGGQIAGALLAMLLIGLAPPAHGRLLLVPLGGGNGAARLALARGALIVGGGPIAGSLVVTGDRATLFGPMLRAGIVPLAAPAIGCGEGV